MKIEQYGTKNDKTIVMLHGAHFVHTWDKAAHNIPPIFYKKFNRVICEMMDLD